jgi:hypothetical protein
MIELVANKTRIKFINTTLVSAYDMFDQYTTFFCWKLANKHLIFFSLPLTHDLRRENSFFFLSFSRDFLAESTSLVFRPQKLILCNKNKEFFAHENLNSLKEIEKNMELAHSFKAGWKINQNDEGIAKVLFLAK